MLEAATRDGPNRAVIGTARGAAMNTLTTYRYPKTRCVLRYRARRRLENWNTPRSMARAPKKACGTRYHLIGAKCCAISDVGSKTRAFFMKVTKRVNKPNITKNTSLD